MWAEGPGWTQAALRVPASASACLPGPLREGYVQVGSF